MMALASRQAIAAVTVTWGNAPAAVCYTAAKALLRRIGRADVPVFLGSECVLPLPHSCPQPAPSSAASEAISHLAAENHGQITVIALGPLSNIAAALRARGSLADDLAGIVIVGGSIDPQAGLARRLAANYYWLPDLGSTELVLGSRVAKTLVPVETMAKAFLEPSWLESVRHHCCRLKAPAAVCDYLPSLATRAEARVMERLFPERRVDGWVPWDAVVMTLVQRPHLFGGWQLRQATVSLTGVVLSRTTTSSVAGQQHEPYLVAVPTLVNRSGCTAHITRALCALRRDEAAAAGADQTPLPIVWPNVPVQLLNRGISAFEPLGVPRSAVACLMVVALAAVAACLRVCCRCVRSTRPRNGICALSLHRPTPRLRSMRSWVSAETVRPTATAWPMVRREQRRRRAPL
jgi:inosine-uridine nucleoside N-ribohydrolase